MLLTFTLDVTFSYFPSRAAALATVAVQLLPPPVLPLPSVSVLLAALAAPSQTLTIQGRVFYNSTSPKATPAAGLSYRWSCVNAPLLDLSSSALVSSSVNQPNLILRAGVLTPGLYTFQLTVADPALASVSNFAQASVYVVSPPLGGVCSVSPATGGESLSTSFSFGCSGWFDPQALEPLQYELRYYDLDTQNSEDPTVTPALLRAAAYSPSFSTLLPSGQLLLRFSVIDSLGAVTYSYFLLPVLNVTLPAAAITDPAGYVTTLITGLLASTLAQQDNSTALLLITQLSAVLNTANSSSLVNTDNLRQTLVSTLATLAGVGTDSTMTTATLVLVTQAVSSLTALPSALANPDTNSGVQNIIAAAIASIPPRQLATPARWSRRWRSRLRRCWWAAPTWMRCRA